MSYEEIIFDYYTQVILTHDHDADYFRAQEKHRFQPRSFVPEKIYSTLRAECTCQSASNPTHMAPVAAMQADEYFNRQV